MFKKIAAMTDLHLGLKSNSIIHNQDCEDYVDWFIETALSEGCETGICLGDWHNNRNSMSLVTLDYSVRCLEKLGKAFTQFFWFPGNHDLYFKDKRNVHSSMFGRNIPGITIVNNITTIDDVTIVPWLISEEWKKMEKLKSRYIFGHFELPNFFLNNRVQMPDHGELQVSHFSKPEYVFSGHFHKRQINNNIVYIGNAFPHNYADAWDDDRGMMILEHGGVPYFKTWENAPKYRTLTLSQLLDEANMVISPKMYLRVNIDLPISFEEATFIKETYMSQYDIRELTLIPEKLEIESDTNVGIEQFDSIDTIVATQLTNIQSESYDPNILLSIYNGL